MASNKTRVDKDVTQLLESFPSLEIKDDGNKVKCRLTGHEMPCRKDAIEKYVQGKKFKRLAHVDPDNLKKYKVHLVPSKKKGHEKQLFCQLTLRHLNKEPHHIKRHVEGHRFKKALAKWEECQETGEKFQPRGGRKKQSNFQPEGKDKSNDWETGSDTGKNVTLDDDMSDLYPAEFFASGDEEDEEENGGGEYEDPAPSTSGQANKRKLVQQEKSKKKPKMNKGKKKKNMT